MGGQGYVGGRTPACPASNWWHVNSVQRNGAENFKVQDALHWLVHCMRSSWFVDALYFAPVTDAEPFLHHSGV
jgi:hypothetical protein